MSRAPVEKLPASPSISGPSVPVADRGGEEVNVGFSDFGADSGYQLRGQQRGSLSGLCLVKGAERLNEAATRSRSTVFKMLDAN